MRSGSGDDENKRRRRSISGSTVDGGLNNDEDLTEFKYEESGTDNENEENKDEANDEAKPVIPPSSSVPGSQPLSQPTSQPTSQPLPQSDRRPSSADLKGALSSDDEKPAQDSDAEKKEYSAPQRPIPMVQRRRLASVDNALPSQKLLNADANSLAKILHSGLTATDPAKRQTAIKSLANFADSADLDTLLKFAQTFELKLRFNNSVPYNLQESLQTLDTALEELKTLSAPPKRNVFEKAVGYKADEDKASVAARATLNKTIKDARKQIVDVIRNIKPEVLPDNDLDNPSWETLITILSNPLINSLNGKPHLGDIFNAIVPGLNANAQNNKIRDALENQGIGNARWVAKKSGGANNPGIEGGQYQQVFIDDDGVLNFRKVFYKQPTEDNGVINYQEGLAEVVGGRIMDNLFETVAAPIYAVALDKDGKPVSPHDKNPQYSTDRQVYAASVFHEKFLDLTALAYERKNVLLGSPVKGRKDNEAEISDLLKEIFLGNGTYKHTYEASNANPVFEADKAEMRKSLGTAALSSILIGNYQIHSDNLGMAMAVSADGQSKEMRVVSLDYGGAMRRDYKTSPVTLFRNLPSSDWKSIHKGITAPKDHGRFERAVRPLEKKGKKYRIAYLQNIPAEIRLSEDFIKGIDTVANSSQAAIIDSVKNEVDYGIERYGAKIFYNEFSYYLDRRENATYFRNQPFKNNPTPNQIAVIRNETAVFLTDTLLARRLSIKEFALESRIEAAIARHTKKNNPALLAQELTDLAVNNPLYALRNPDAFKQAGKNIDTKNAYDRLPGGKVLQIIFNELNIVKQSGKGDGLPDVAPRDANGLRRAAQLIQKRAKAFLNFNSEQLDTLKQLGLYQDINELVLSRNFLNMALNSSDYATEMDYDIIALATDDHFDKMKNLLAKLPADLLDKVVADQIAMTPKNAPNSSEPRAIITETASNKYYNEFLNLSAPVLFGGLVEIPQSPSPSPSVSLSAEPSSSVLNSWVNQPSRSSISELKNDESNVNEDDVSQSRSRSASFSSFNSDLTSENSTSRTSSQSASPSISSLGLFTRHLKKSFTDLLTDFVVKIANVTSKDKLARDATRQFVVSDIGKELKDNAALIKVNNLMTTGNIHHVHIPEHTYRTPEMDPMSFAQHFGTVDDVALAAPAYNKLLHAKFATSLNDAPPPGVNVYAVNYVQSKSAPAPDLNKPDVSGMAVFLESRIDNVYSIQAVKLPPEVSRTFLLEKHFLDNLDADTIDLLRQRLRTTEISAYSSQDETSVNATLRSEVTALLKSSNLADDKITAFLDDYAATCRQPIANSPLHIPATGYFEFVQAQILRFLSEAGSNKTIRIVPTNDPLLAQAYVLYCEANKISYNNKSGFEFKQSMANADILRYVKENFTAKPHVTLAAVKTLVDEVHTKLQTISAPDDLALNVQLEDFKEQVRELQGKVNKGEYVPTNDIYQLIEKISTATSNGQNLREAPELSRPGRHNSF